MTPRFKATYQGVTLGYYETYEEAQIALSKAIHRARRK